MTLAACIPLPLGFSLAAPLMGLLALAAIPVVIVYFLKLRRPRQTVPSLVLWQRVLEDQRVNSPFQRFRKNLLLWLQLALLALLVLACMQPLLTGGASDQDRVPIVVDCSASMAAVDADGRSRIDRVRELLREEIESLSGDRELSIVAAGPRATRLCEFTSNPTILRAAVERLRAYPAPTNLDEALRLTEGMTIANAIEQVRLYSDGNLPVDPDGEPGVAVIPFDLPFVVDFRRVGEPLGNVGLVEATAQRSGSGEWDVFLRIAAGERPARAALRLTQDGEPLREETIALDAGQSQRLTFTIEAAGATTLLAELEPKQADALAADDRVRLDLPTSRDLRVRIASGLEEFRYALQGADSTELVDVAADLAIVNEASELADEPAALVVGGVPESLAEFVALADGHRDIIDWQRSDPLLQHVRLSGVLLGRSPQYRDGAGRQQLEEAGYRVVAEVSGGPLIVRRQDGRNLRYAMLFRPSQSTLTYRVGFPVLVSNLVDIGFRQSELSAVRGLRSGVVPAVAVENPGDYVVTGPDGYEATFDVGEDRLLRGVVADAVGDYEVTAAGGLAAGPAKTFGVSLLDPTESSLASVDTIEFAEVEVAASDREVSTEQPLWRWLALGALGLLLFEWWYFHRPVAAPIRGGA